MATRPAALVVALVLVVVTGMARSALYLCPMNGHGQAACCCKGSGDDELSDCAKLERKSRCCEVKAADFSEPLGIAKDHVPHAFAQLAVSVLAPPRIDVQGALVSTAARPLGARAPPWGSGASLFVLNCRYLI